MVLPLEAEMLRYALLFLSLGLFFAFLLVVAVLVEALDTKLRLAEWFDSRD